MPASQPVDYVASVNCLVFDQPYIAGEDIDMLRSLADQLTALREAKSGCDKEWQEERCGRVWADGTIHLCCDCEMSLFEVVANITHTNPRDAHG